MTKSELIAAMDAHDAEGERLEKAMAELGLDAKKIKAIRKAEAASEKARATLRELMGEPVSAVEPTVTNAALPEVTPTQETPAENKKGGK